MNRRCDPIEIGWIWFIVMCLCLLTYFIFNAISNISLEGIGTADYQVAAVWDEKVDLAMLEVIVDPAYSHALVEHPDTAPVVWECMKAKGPYITFQVDPGRRYLRVCLIDDQTFGFQIVDYVGKKMMEKTAYIRDELKCVKDLFSYARRMGYPRFTKPIF